MMPIEFKPSLSECIETLAKREYRESLRSCLASPENSQELQEKVELLRLFLESADFSKLRVECERRLLEGRDVKFTLSLVNGKPEIKMIVE
jgi:hypothetical protein